MSRRKLKPPVVLLETETHRVIASPSYREVHKRGGPDCGPRIERVFDATKIVIEERYRDPLGVSHWMPSHFDTMTGAVHAIFEKHPKLPASWEVEENEEPAILTVAGGGPYR